MADFVQTFQLEESICDEIISNITITDKSHKQAITVEIQEIEDDVIKFMYEYLEKIKEFNYFGDLHRTHITVDLTQIRYIPSHSYQLYEEPKYGFFYFFIFLKDNESVFDIFNPFVRGDVRFRPRKGLVIIIPAIWMFMFRHGDTAFKDSIFISGALSINNLNNEHES